MKKKQLVMGLILRSWTIKNLAHPQAFLHMTY